MNYSKNILPAFLVTLILTYNSHAQVTDASPSYGLGITSFRPVIGGAIDGLLSGNGDVAVFRYSNASFSYKNATYSESGGLIQYTTDAPIYLSEASLSQNGEKLISLNPGSIRTSAALETYSIDLQ